MLVSIVLPLAENESREKIKRSLDSLKNQSYKNFEVIIVTFPESSKTLSYLFKKYPFIRKILIGSWNKSTARNLGAKQAKGKYLLHLDADMQLSPDLLLELAQKARQNELAVIVPHQVSENTNFWGKCRALEAKVIVFKDPVLETPIFLKKSLFRTIGGFDKDLDPLDDWGLHLALKQQDVKFSYTKNQLIFRVSPSLKESWQRMFARGQAVPRIEEKYPSLPQIRISNKIKIYQKKWQLFCLSPFLAGGLFFLKIIDFLAFTWGRYHPQQPYTLTGVAMSFEEKRLGSNFTRYKHFVEIQALFNLLGPFKKNILEVGCGTGRITSELIKKKYQIVPLDPSEAMLREFRKKKNLPEPIRTSGSKLPFKKSEFKTVLALRVLWHLPPDENEKLISEMSRVSSQFLILDIVNKKRFLAKILIGPNTYPSVLKDFLALHRKNGWRAESILPLDVSLPIWLNLIPQKLAEKLFPFLYKLDLALAKIIPPGRYLLKLEKFA